MSGMYRDRCFCTRSAVGSCANTACDRFVDATVRRLAAKAKQPIGWADLMTSKCGFVPREAK